MTSALALLFGAATLRADIAGVDFTTVNNSYTNGPWSLGWSFTTLNSIQISALGDYDANLTGLAGAVGLAPGCNCGQVGLFDSSGNLLASALVTATDPGIGFFRYQNINPIVLPAGQTFTLEAETGSSQYTWDTGGFTVNPNITFDQDEYVYSSTLAFGTSSEGITAASGGAFFGPNFLDGPVSAPEPSSLVLLGSISLGAFAAVRLRRKRWNSLANRL